MLPLLRAPARIFLLPRPILHQPFFRATLLPSRAIPLPTTPQCRALTNEAAVLHDSLLKYNESKWGWVIYRTTYTDPPSANPITPGLTSDQTWALLKTRLVAEAGDGLSIEYPNNAAAPEDAAAVQYLRNAMDWVFVEDRQALEGATREQLRERFKKWREPAMKEEVGEVAPEVAKYQCTTSERYRFFLVVDEEAMESIAEGDGSAMDGAWLNLVRCDEETEDGGLEDEDEAARRRERWEWYKRMGGREKEQAEREEAELAETGKVDVGWFMVAVDMIGHEFYNTMGGPLDHWYLYYRPPPEVLWS